MTTVNSNAPADDVPILLYSNTNLTLGDHSLEVRVVDGSFPNVCEVDRFVCVDFFSSISSLCYYCLTFFFFFFFSI